MILLTDNAVKQIKFISDNESIGHYTVRVKVIGGGCAGFSYDMFYDTQIGEMDEISELDGVKIVADLLSFQYLDQVVIDYVESPLGGGGFKFKNPNVKNTCGCGSSFSV